jgi:capsular polysaccharide biosynthesis protein
MPQYHCLYSSEGIRINDSCLYRGYNHTQLVTKAPDKIKLTKPLKKIFKKFIYVGGIGEHYGHFLTESIARLWYAIKDERYLILCHGLSTRNTTKRTFIDLFFEAVKLDKHRFISFKAPILLEEVIVPYPSFVNRGEGFEIHKLLPESVAKSLLSENYKMTSQPLYFSRRSLSQDRRLIINEDRLEEELRKHGFAIFCPEKLSLKQQIHLVNKHEVIIGAIGSALHNILFDVSSRRNIVYLSSGINPNYLIIDAIKSVNSGYINALKKDPNCQKEESFTKNQILDIEIALDGLRHLSLI